MILEASTWYMLSNDGQHSLLRHERINLVKIARSTIFILQEA